MPRCAASARSRLKALGTRAAVLMSLSCTPTSWTPILAPASGTYPADTRLQVWRGCGAVILRDVTVDVDSIRGRVVDPLRGPPRARIALARSDVDSLRRQPRDQTNWFGAGVAFGVLGTIVVPYLMRLLSARGT